MNHRLPQISHDSRHERFIMLTQQMLKDRLYYEDGKLYWKKTLSNAVKVNTEAGTLNQVGYRQISLTFDKKRYLVLTHRLVYLYHFGFMPKEIDHINLIKTDNRIENLREATRSQNIVNNTPRKDNTSGQTGIYFCKSTNKWIARVWKGGKKIWSASFNDLEQATYERKLRMVAVYDNFVRN